MRSLAIVLTALLATSLLGACRKSETQTEAPAAAEDWNRPEVIRYDVRGEVLRLPVEGAFAEEIVIRHETIADFKDADGEVVGMKAMSMPFPIQKGVSLEGIAPGDKVAFRFAMDWPNNRYQLESIQKLPDDTVLEFDTSK